MRKNLAGFVACVALSMLPCAPALAAPSWTTVQSPNGQAGVAARVSDGGEVQWQVSWHAKPVLSPATIGLTFAGTDAPPALEATGVRHGAHDERVDGLIGKASSARDHYREAVIALRERDGERRRLELVLRAYDDGVAYRWRVVDAGGPFALAGEDAGFGVPGDAQAWAMPVVGYDSSYEEYYRSGRLADTIDAGQLIALPLLLRTAGGAWAALMEAALSDWAGLYLMRADGGDAGLQGRLSPLPDEPGIAVRSANASHDAPWRVVLLGDRPGALLESNLVMLLNPPPDARDWSWVKPGKTAFPWWNDYAWPGADFTPGLNTATMLAYIDFCADNGIPYHTLDGYQDKAWYGGPIGPDGTPQDLTTATPDIDMPAVLKHAKARGVRLRLWTHWEPLRDQMDEALATWARWGIEGIMVDFMNRDDQEMVRFHEDVVRKAAAHHMTVVFHGTYKPTGEGRTWPNLLTREAVRGLEYDKFENNPGSTPGHEATVPFTRMLAGPLDFHQGGFDHVAPKDFANRFHALQVMGTRARAMALYVVYDDPLPMVADTPVNYRGAVGWPFVAAIPTAWDETRVLAGMPGEAIVTARRSGDRWWLGAITNADARTLTVTLPMPASARYRLEDFSDDPATLSAPRHASKVMHGGETLQIAMAAAGGYAATLTPLSDAPAPAAQDDMPDADVSQ